MKKVMGIIGAILIVSMACTTTKIENKKADSGLGEQCGGFAGLVCKGDLVCQPKDSMVVDGFGVCIGKGK
jgi:hypothetical protein